MRPVHLAIFWHQHQPYYPDDVSGENLMPWVRLHGTKDYYGMALHLKEVPEFHCTINLVPSLLVQLLQYTDKGGSDRHLDVSRLPADGFSATDMNYLLDQFYMASVDNMIRPFARYYELYLKRGFGTDSPEQAAQRFTPRDIRDLQVWSNLTWMHPLAFELDKDLADFREKGSGYSEDEKAWLLDKQLEILRKIIPLHRELAEAGQVEITTTPFYHPILPLLWDKRSAHQAMPGCALPENLDSYAEDAILHINRGVAFHEELFGEKPKGMWPSEGSVSQDIIQPIAEAGIKWIATDEQILAESTDHWVGRDGNGHMRNAEMLYRPWEVAEGDDSLQIVFRDHGLSDLVGFQYQRSDPNHAADDLINRVLSIGASCEGKMGDRPTLVPIILDGENCWEYYADGGVSFLRTLYHKCAQDKRIHPTRICDHVEHHPATDKLGNLFAGSWIYHNFAIWIGHQEDNTAWDAVHQTREFLKAAQANGEHSEEQLSRAWEELYIAEGSDWYWWFGDDHSSAQDALFDQLFRRHLQNVYALLDEPAPPNLAKPITSNAPRAIHTQPKEFLDIEIDGRGTYFEWVNAGRYTAGSERGTMTLVTKGLIQTIDFGYDLDAIYLRIDTENEAARDLSRIDELRVVFLEPAGYELRIRGWKKNELRAKLLKADGKVVPRSKVEFAVGPIVEIRIPWADLGVKAGQPVHFCAEVVAGKNSTERAPSEGAVELTAPTADYESVVWQV